MYAIYSEIEEKRVARTAEAQGEEWKLVIVLGYRPTDDCFPAIPSTYA